MLTYKPEDGPSPSEDATVKADEPKPVPSDDVAVSTAEVTTPAPPPSTKNLDTDDLLVDLSLHDSFTYLCSLEADTPAFCIFGFYKKSVLWIEYRV